MQTASRWGGLSFERSSMGARVYQESQAGAAPRRRLTAGLLACLAALALLALLACDEQTGKPVVAGSDQETEPPRGLTIHYSKLVPFAPAALLEYRGGPTVASTSRFGEVAVSEIERNYTWGPRRLKLRIVDTNINRGARAPNPAEAFENAEKIGKPLLTGGAVGFVEYEKASRRAQADLIVAERILVTVTGEDVAGPEPIERFSAALDLNALAQVVHEEAARP